MSERYLDIIKGETQSYIWVKTADGSIQKVEEKVAVCCGMICQEVLLKGLGTSMNHAIPLPHSVNQDMFSLILDYCRFHLMSGRSDKERKNYNKKFYRMDKEMLYELVLAAASLQVKPLVDLTCLILSRTVEGKKPEEMREVFNLPDDLTEEEKLKPLKNTMNDPGIRLLNRLNAKNRKELKDRERWKNVQVEEHKDERSVDDLVSFINGGGLIGSKESSVSQMPRWQRSQREKRRKRTRRTRRLFPQMRQKEPKRLDPPRER